MLCQNPDCNHALMWVNINLGMLVGLACDRWRKRRRWSNQLVAIRLSHHPQSPVNMAEGQGTRPGLEGPNLPNVIGAHWHVLWHSSGLLKASCGKCAGCSRMYNTTGDPPGCWPNGRPDPQTRSEAWRRRCRSLQRPLTTDP
jgi:hypothetical protein